MAKTNNMQIGEEATKNANGMEMANQDNEGNHCTYHSMHNHQVGDTSTPLSPDEGYVYHSVVCYHSILQNEEFFQLIQHNQGVVGLLLQ
eukprot:5381583-Ditylum_brightwellii.AAC.1